MTTTTKNILRLNRHSLLSSSPPLPSPLLPLLRFGLIVGVCLAPMEPLTPAVRRSIRLPKSRSWKTAPQTAAPNTGKFRWPLTSIVSSSIEIHQWWKITEELFVCVCSRWSILLFALFVRRNAKDWLFRSYEIDAPHPRSRKTAPLPAFREKKGLTHNANSAVKRYPRIRWNAGEFQWQLIANSTATTESPGSTGSIKVNYNSIIYQ